MFLKFSKSCASRDNRPLTRKTAGPAPHFGAIFNRQSAGFTLAELIMAVLIFGFMIASLSTIYSTANKHLFRNYRLNNFKSTASVAMKTITARLQEATYIEKPDKPGPLSPVTTSESLAFAVNVDQVTGCYPINSLEPASWHYFCRSQAVNTACPSGSCLYYHTGAITGGGGCPAGARWTYPAVICGATGGAVTLLASFVDVTTLPALPLFSRSLADGSAVVNINLRLRWDPAANYGVGRDFRTTDKLIDTTLRTSVRVNCAVQ